MEGRGAFLRVGLLILGGTAVLIGAVFILAGSQFRGGVPFESYFRESVQGLEVGAPVKYLGVTVGRVTNIALASAVYGHDMPIGTGRDIYRDVYVRFIIDPKRVGRLPDSAAAAASGLRAKLASQGLTGLSYIELAFVDPVAYPAQMVPWKPRDDVLPTIPSTLTQVQEAGEQFLAKLNRVDIEALVRNATALVGDLDAALKDGDVHRTLARAQDALGELQTQLRQANLTGLSADLREVAHSANTLLSGPQTREMIANAATAMARLTVLVAALQTATQRAGNGTSDVVAALGPILRDMQAVASNLRETTSELRRYPAGALLGGPPPREQPAR